MQCNTKGNFNHEKYTISEWRRCVGVHEPVRPMHYLLCITCKNIECLMCLIEIFRVAVSRSDILVTRLGAH